MKLTKTSEYALRILSYMINSNQRVFTAKLLVETLHVPDKYLRRLMTDLSKKGFIKSIQGREGGYVFAKNPEKIFLSDIIDAVEGMEKYEGCLLGFAQCSEENPCSLHQIWGPIRDVEVAFLRETSLDQIINKDIHKF